MVAPSPINLRCIFKQLSSDLKRAPEPYNWAQLNYLKHPRAELAVISKPANKRHYNSNFLYSLSSFLNY